MSESVTQALEKIVSLIIELAPPDYTNRNDDNLCMS